MSINEKNLEIQNNIESFNEIKYTIKNHLRIKSNIIKLYICKKI